MSYDGLLQALKGGKGSGNFGHEGRPKMRGGSAPGSIVVGSELLRGSDEIMITKLIKILPKSHMALVKKITIVDDVPFHPEAAGSYMEGNIEVSATKSGNVAQIFLHEMGEMASQRFWPHPKNLSESDLTKMTKEISIIKRTDPYWLGLTSYERDYSLNETHAGLYRLWATALSGDVSAKTAQVYWRDNLPFHASTMDDIFAGRLPVRHDIE